MPYYTTIERVRNRIKDLSFEISDAKITEYIDDAEGYINLWTQQIFAGVPADPPTANSINFNGARQAATDLAAFYAVIQSVGGTYVGLSFKIDDEVEVDDEDAVENYLRIAFEFRTSAQRTIFNLPRVIVQPVMN